MRITVRKHDSNYLLGEGNGPLPEQAWEVLPYLHLPAGCFLWLLLKAALDLDLRYYRNPDDDTENGLNYEMDFYNHLGCRWEVYSQDIDVELTVNNDIVKRIPDEIKPDLILNVRWEDRQEVVAEFKRNVQATDLDRIYRDWEKLFSCTKGKYNRSLHRYEFIPGYESYKLGVFFFIGGNMDELVDRIREDVPRFKHFMKKIGAWKDRLFCVCSTGNGFLEYVTMRELAQEPALRRRIIQQAQ